MIASAATFFKDLKLLCSVVHSGPHQISMVGPFAKLIITFLAVNYFRKSSFQLFDRVPNAPLNTPIQI